MILKQLIGLVETGSDSFYTHLNIENQVLPAELYWLNKQWQFRPFCYLGEWILIDSPLVLKLNEPRLIAEIEFFLLMELYCYDCKLSPVSEFREQCLRKYFKEERILNMRQQMIHFENSLLLALEKVSE